jgi:hypothetical protein
LRDAKSSLHGSAVTRTRRRDSGRAVAPWQLAFLLWIVVGCRAETRGWVLSERDATAPRPAIDDAGCAGCVDAGPTGDDGGELAADGGSRTPLHGSQGGMEYVDVCPGDQVLIGYRGSVGDVSASADPLVVTRSLQAVCGTARETADGAITITRAGTLPQRGSPGEIASWSQPCPTDAAIIGVQGRAGLALDQVAFVCARLMISPAGGTLAIESATVSAAAGGDGGRAFADSCPAGEVARGHLLRAGRWIDAFSLVCGALPPEREP